MDTPGTLETDAGQKPTVRKPKRKRTKTKVLEAAVSRHFAAQFGPRLADLRSQLDEAKAEANAKAVQGLREVDERLRPAVLEAEGALRRLYKKLGIPVEEARLHVHITIPGLPNAIGLNHSGPVRHLVIELSATVLEIQRQIRLLQAERDAAELEVLEAMDTAQTIEAKRRVLAARGIAEHQGVA